ncbi:MAG TPA: cytochrome d ubiquinol oxidase subunit II [Brevundimonas sp.]|jgi:cytochrome d ubiquinol oxidase subunit II|uniref:cytochrome d ubiquinol oxidase subunit II n=1 Tax=Brevundimonas sp. TaxID=1871086 RepID=UPI002CFB2BB7|nr:cytochrome d ubiquinol oxidase subunit II [Brevundimonas sp.]HRH20424.1 cytochrome d ubiquinol oxidase subunit II [Brevundimonas sp.]
MIDLPLIWAALIATAVLLYVLLDGFDLGVGILFPFARTPQDRDVMMNTIAPVWDGNETWLVLGGGGLLAAFPIAYSVLMPAFYLPVAVMLSGLILRGVAFEFRSRARKRGRAFWTAMFALGSILATFAQGLILGGFIQGVRVEGTAFAGGLFDWFTPYCLIVAFGLITGYALLGATWLILKTEDDLHGDARRWAVFTAVLVAVALVAVSISTLSVHHRVGLRWGIDTAEVLINWSVLLPRLVVPGLGLAGLLVVTWGLATGRHLAPFVGSILVFLSGFAGLAVGFFPYVVPYALDFRQAAAPDNALALMLFGTVFALPLILGYTAWVYWVFRGKVTPEAGYH